MPVLKSYWLKIHVATIVSSYAPLALSAVLGLMALILMIFKTSTTKNAIDIRIKELTYINELSMTIGLFILAIGTFLGVFGRMKVGAVIGRGTQKKPGH